MKFAWRLNAALGVNMVVTECGRLCKSMFPRRSIANYAWHASNLPAVTLHEVASYR